MNTCFLRLMLAGFTALFATPRAPTIRVAANLVLTPVRVTDAGGPEL